MLVSSPVTLDGLLPKAISPSHYLKKIGLMPKGGHAPAAPDTSGQDIASRGRAILLSSAAVAVVLLIMLRSSKGVK